MGGAVACGMPLIDMAAITSCSEELDSNFEEDFGDKDPLIGINSIRLKKQSKFKCWKYIKNPKHWPYRYHILLHFCVIRFLLNAIYEVPGGLEDTIIEVMELDYTRYDLIYSIYSWSVIPTALIGGLIIDRIFGIRFGLIVFVIISNIGQLICVLSVIFNQYWILLFGRLVMGLGCETALFTIDAFTLLWFKENKEFNFVFGIIATVNRLGGSFSLFINQPLYDAFDFISRNTYRLGIVFSINFGFSLICVISSIITFAMDKRAEQTLLFERKNEQQKKRFSCKDLKSFNLNFWLIAFASGAYYGSYYPLVTVGQLFFVNKYGLSIYLANTANMLTYLGTITAPIVGIFFTFIGFPIYWGLFALLLSIMMHFLLALSGGQFFIPFIATSIIALTYDVFKAGVWPLIGVVVPKHQLATAFGVVTGLLNLSYALNTMAVAVIIDHIGYFLMEIYLILLQGLGVIFIMIIIINIAGSNSKLDMSGWKARKLQKKTTVF